jgi:hypothetical protein
MNLLWRLLAILPPGLIHEKHVRNQLGMPRRHPERCTRPGARREQRTLAWMQARTWPRNEWVDVISYQDGAW